MNKQNLNHQSRLDVIKEHYGLSGTTLKWIAIIVMGVGHFTYLTTIVPQPWWTILIVFAYLTPPTICYFIAEGFFYTRNRKRYAQRLFIFALIAQIPYSYCKYGIFFDLSLHTGTFNMLFSLFLGLCSLWIIKSSLKTIAKIALITMCVLGSVICEWPLWGILLILAFGLNRGSFKLQAIWFSVITICFTLAWVIRSGAVDFFMYFCMFLVLPLLALYNGKKASESTPAWMTNRWIFYVFYPLHLLILGILIHGVGWLH